MQRDDIIPINSMVPSDPEPIVIFEQNAALRVALVDRSTVKKLDETWDLSGVYVLVDPIQHDGTWNAYVGKSPSGVRKRLRQHLKNKPSWQRAVLVTRDTTHGWHSAQVGWLEGRIYNMLEGVTHCTLHNENRPQDETLPPHERIALEHVINPIRAILRLIGYPPDVYDEETPELSSNGNSRTSTYYGVKIRDLFDHDYLNENDRLVSVRPGYPASAKIDGEGRIVLDGATFTSPSAAGEHVRGGSVAGWDFWALENDGETVPLAAIRKRYIDNRNKNVVSDKQVVSTVQGGRTRRVKVGAVKDLLEQQLLQSGETLYPIPTSVLQDPDVTATVTADGKLLVADKSFDSPSSACSWALNGKSWNGWDFWRAKRGDDFFTLSELRDKLAVNQTS